MFKKILVEKEIWQNNSTLTYARIKKILDFYQQKPILIDKIENYFGRVKKPYRQKSDSLNLYLGVKKGKLVKKTPPGYGFMPDKKHYFFIYSYNCLFECEYCYLQGYFHSPDIVYFVNYEEIIAEMKNIIKDNPDKKIWFHGGEFNDNLALAKLTEEWPIFWNFFSSNPQTTLELRTKSAQVSSLLNLQPLKNIVISFSLNPSIIIKEFEKKTPSLMSRIKSIKLLLERGFMLGLHIDPIIYTKDFKNCYLSLLEKLANLFKNYHNQLKYISLGTLRFVKQDYQAVRVNYPNSNLWENDFIVGFDQKVRYPRPQRNWIMDTLKDYLIKNKFSPYKIYYCMEKSNEL